MCLSPFHVPQTGWKPPEAADDVADFVCGHEKFGVLAVPDERYPYHQNLESHHGNNIRNTVRGKKTLKHSDRLF